MAEVVNLRMVRKARKRLEDESRAAAKRLAHGRTKAEKRETEMAGHRLRTVLEGARRERGEE